MYLQDEALDFPKMGRLGRIEGTRELVVWANYIIIYQENTFTVQIACSATMAILLNSIHFFSAISIMPSLSVHYIMISAAKLLIISPQKYQMYTLVLCQLDYV